MAELYIDQDGLRPSQQKDLGRDQVRSKLVRVPHCMTHFWEDAVRTLYLTRRLLQKVIRLFQRPKLVCPQQILILKNTTFSVSWSHTRKSVEYIVTCPRWLRERSINVREELMSCYFGHLRPQTHKHKHTRRKSNSASSVSSSTHLPSPRKLSLCICRGPSRCSWCFWRNC